MQHSRNLAKTTFIVRQFVANMTEDIVFRAALQGPNQIVYEILLQRNGWGWG